MALRDWFGKKPAGPPSAAATGPTRPVGVVPGKRPAAGSSGGSIPAGTAGPLAAADAAGGRRSAVPGIEVPPWALLQRRLVALPILAFGLALLLGGVPRTIAALVSAGGEPVIRQIERQETVTVEDLQAVIDAQESGLVWVDDAQMESHLGLAHLLLAEKLDRTDPAAAIHLDHARHTLRTSLGRAPANPYPWTLLAYAEFLKAGTWSNEAMAALRLSMLTGPYEPRLLWSRLRLGLLAWDNLPEADQRLLMQQVRYAWSQDPKDLARLAVELKRVYVVRIALEQVPDASAGFEEILKTLGA